MTEGPETEVIQNLFASREVLDLHTKFEALLTEAAISQTIEAIESARLALEDFISASLEVNRGFFRRYYLAGIASRYQNSPGMIRTIKHLEESYA
jgi:hypothetical protein